MIKLLTILALSVLVGAGCSEIDLGAVKTQAENLSGLETRIDIIQADWIKTHDKYKYIPKTTDPKTGIVYKTDEYGNSKNEIGYQISYYDKQDRVATTTATGLNASSRTKVIDFPIITPTST